MKNEKMENNILKQLSEVLHSNGTDIDFKVVDKSVLVFDLSKTVNNEVQTVRYELPDFIFWLKNAWMSKEKPVVSEENLCEHPLDKRFWGKVGGKCLVCGRLFFN